MTVSKTLYTTAYSVPENDEKSWGSDMTGWIEKANDGLDDTTALLASGNVVPKTTYATAATMAADSTLTQTHGTHKISGTPGAVTLSTTTAITDGTVDGQRLQIVGNHATNTVTINDNSNVQLKGNVTLALHDSITLEWDETLDDWREVCRSVA